MHAADAIDSDLVEELADEERREWRLLGDEGVVSQHAFGSYLPLDTARAAVRRVAERLVAGLSDAAYKRDLPALPSFNEVTWGLYPQGTGRITKHADPADYGGVIAIFALLGAASFRVFGPDAEVVEWQTGPGQLGPLRGARWPHETSRCPRHEVDPPESGERMIVTLRSNSGERRNRPHRVRIRLRDQKRIAGSTVHQGYRRVQNL
jgi:hypothetical protein